MGKKNTRRVGQDKDIGKSSRTAGRNVYLLFCCCFVFCVFFCFVLFPRPTGQSKRSLKRGERYTDRHYKMRESSGMNMYY